MKLPILFTALLAAATPAFADGIVCAPDAPAQVRLAAKEIRRYAYLRTGVLLNIAAQAEGKRVVLRIDAALAEQEYRLKTEGDTLTISGGSPVAVLYGAYDLAGKWGVGFYLHADAVPDEKIPFALPTLDETHKPLFETRGIQPFHDFAEGPDWWTTDDYKTVMAQLAKMRMNFIGMHCYPERPSRAGYMMMPEPIVWFGLTQDLTPKGKVTRAYPATWCSTAHTTNGFNYAAMPTGTFAGGAASLFADDIHAAEVQKGLAAPPSASDSPELFNRVGAQLGETVRSAHEVGVKVCLGTEAPMTVPLVLQKRLKELGKDFKDPAVVREIYKGAFTWLDRNVKPDYYWLWTPEPWTWRGNTQAQFDATAADFKAAITAWEELGKPFQLATCGWVLGPQQDRSAWSKILPPGAPIGCINRHLGHESIEPTFSNIKDRPAWAIPWAENDGNMIGYQPWAKRMRYDAADALRRGCTGLMGIHWRTSSMAANLSALAQAGWDQSYVPAAFKKAVPPPAAKPKPAATPDAAGAPGDENAIPEGAQNFPVAGKNRGMPSETFYADFARANFGKVVAAEAGAILDKVDGAIGDVSGWTNGPGNVLASNIPWSQAKKRFAWIDGFAALRPRVTGRGELERFDQWLATFRATAAIVEAGCLRGDLDKAMGALKAAKETPAKAEKAGLALAARLALARGWERLLSIHTQAVITTGELGTIANIEQHSRMYSHFVDAHDKALATALGAPLPPEVTPSPTAYDGPARLSALTRRDRIRSGEVLSVPLVAPAATPVKSVVVKVRPMGSGAWKSLLAKHEGRAAWRAELPAASADFEYFVEALTADGETLRWPASAPEIAQTVIVE